MLIACLTDVLQVRDKTFIKSTIDTGIVLIRHVERSETQSKHLAEASLVAVATCRVDIDGAERYSSEGGILRLRPERHVAASPPERAFPMLLLMAKLTTEIV